MWLSLCAVCKQVIDSIDKTVTEEDRKSVEKIEKKMFEWCATAKGKDKTMVSSHPASHRQAALALLCPAAASAAASAAAAAAATAAAAAAASATASAATSAATAAPPAWANRAPNALGHFPRPHSLHRSATTSVWVMRSLARRAV